MDKVREVLWSNAVEVSGNTANLQSDAKLLITRMRKLPWLSDLAWAAVLAVTIPQVLRGAAGLWCLLTFSLSLLQPTPHNLWFLFAVVLESIHSFTPRASVRRGTFVYECIDVHFSGPEYTSLCTSEHELGCVCMNLWTCVTL